MWLSGKQPASQCRRRNTYRFDPWVGKIPWRRKWQLASSILAWKIPWTEEPGGLQSMGSQRVRHDLEAEHTPLRTHMHSQRRASPLSSAKLPPSTT